MNEVRIVGNDLIISVDEVTATIENAAIIEDNRRLQAENAKLRELVKRMYSGICAAYVAGRPLAPYQYEGDARELGVEVDA